MTDSTTLNVLNASADTSGRAELTAAFRQAGFNVWEAASGKEALSMIPMRPDLILLDHALPGMPLSEICCHIKEHAATANTPVFYLDGMNGAATSPPPGIGSLPNRILRQPWRPFEVVKAARGSLQLRKIELLSQLFFDAASDAVVIINESGAMIHLNRQTENLFGYRRDELLNQPMELLLPEKLRARHAEYRRRYFDKPLTRPMGSNFSGTGQRKDGSEIPIDIALSPLQLESGLYVASTIRDISRQRQLEIELRQHVRDLEDADRHKDQFLMTLAHELRTPLTAVTFSAELLRRPGIATEIRKKALGIVMEETAFIRRLVDDLSELSHIRRNELPMRMAPVDLCEVARFAIEISRPLIKQHQHELGMTIPAASLLVNGDATRITQIITNLLNNSARYTHNGGHIHLSLEIHNDAVLISVKDDGIGIPKERLTQIFEIFTRLDAARSKYAGGLGIGLAFVRRLAEMQGGSAQAFSDGEGLGSEFVVNLPLLRDIAVASGTPTR